MDCMYEVTDMHGVQMIYFFYHTRKKPECSVNHSVNKNCLPFLVNDYFRNSQNTICVIKNNYVNSTVVSVL